jgi:pilus assembly protein CpaB
MKYLSIIIALLLAVVAAFVVIQFTGNDEAPPPSVRPQPVAQQPVAQQQAPATKVVDVYVASRQIPIGTKITEQMLTTQPWPEHLQVPGFVVGPEEGRKLVGMVTRAQFERDEPLVSSKLVNPEDPNFLANALPEGKRMVTIETDVVSAVGGFVFPGDRVDVLFTYNVDLAEMSGEGREYEGIDKVDATETLLYNIRVLAVDQQATAGINPEKGIIVPRSVSLEVTPEDAQKIRLAEEIGDLSLTLRSLKDKDSTATVPVVDQTVISAEDWAARAGNKSGGKPKASAGGSSKEDELGIRVVRGTEVEVVGGEE